MSGIEVAGLALGALPVLFAALDGYKQSMGRMRSALKKRDHVKRMARALRLQERSLVALIETVLRQCGCDVPGDELELPLILNQKETRELVDDFLGPKDACVLTETLDDCIANLQRTTRRVAELVPTLKEKANSAVQDILEANETAKKGQVDFLARFNVVMKLGDLQRDIEDLDKSTEILDRFANRIMGNRSLDQSSPSRKAMKLAKTLKNVRQNSEKLHAALQNFWSNPCHDTHELKLFLEDRIMSTRPNQPRMTNTGSFKVVFASDVLEPSPLWYTTTVVPVIQDDDDTPVPGPTKIRIVAPSSPSNLNTKKDIQDICMEIQTATKSKLHPVFYLANHDKIAVLHEPRIIHAQCAKADSIAFRAVLSNAVSSTTPLPVKPRMVLALKLASSFLQFLNTPWMPSCWSGDDINFLVDTTSPHRVDLNQPYLSQEFCQASHCTNPYQAQLKTHLIELGILLLEVWHGRTLEAEFGDPTAVIKDPFSRHARALQWLDDVHNPLPDLYHKAVSHCLIPVYAGDARVLDWDDDQLWKLICENVIDPLSKLAEM